ncbi:MAG: hypothetical protein GX247_04750, partial [Mollicutes bacterium]|nr:hypothetical protein [Mollicutes bacterium]
QPYYYRVCAEDNSGNIACTNGNKVTPTDAYYCGGLSGTAVASNVLSGKTFYNSSGNLVTGSMPNRGGVVITPGANNQTIQAGYHDGSGYVKGDPDLIPENIREGVNIFNVVGTWYSYLNPQNVTTVNINHYRYVTSHSDTGERIIYTLPSNWKAVLIVANYNEYSNIYTRASGYDMYNERACSGEITFAGATTIVSAHSKGYDDYGSQGVLFIRASQNQFYMVAASYLYYSWYHHGSLQGTSFSLDLRTLSSNTITSNVWATSGFDGWNVEIIMRATLYIFT